MALTKIKTGSVSDSITLTTPDINGGTIDATVIGGTTPAAISGTTGQFGTSLNVDGTATVDGLTVNVSADSDSVATITSTATANNTQLRLGTNGNDSVISGTGGSNGALAFKVFGTERMRIDSSGNVIVGTTNPAPVSNNVVGVSIRNFGEVQMSTNNQGPLYLNRKGTDGAIVTLRKENVDVGSIGTVSNGLYIASPVSSDSGLRFSGSTVHPCTTTGAPRDNAIDLGYASGRFNDIYATNGTIQTSDRNEKQDIEELSTAETAVAVACKSFLRKFRWKDSVAEKGDDARIHFGIIAQDLQVAFAAEGLDAGDYAMFISSTWWETQTEVDSVEAVEATEDTEAVEAKDAYTRTDTFYTLAEAPTGATERTRLGVRYPELLAFIISAI